MPPKRPLARKRQTKLNFSPASDASPKPAKIISVSSDSSDAGPSPSHPAKRRRLEQETMRGMNLGMPVTQSKRSMFDSSDNEINISSGSSSSSDDSDSGDGISVLPAPTKARRQAQRVEDSDEENDRSKHAKRAARRAPTPQDDTSEEESENEVHTIPRKQRRRRDHSKALSNEEAPRSNKRNRWTKRRASTPEGGIEEEQEQDDRANDEADELKEELAFLQSSPLPNRERLRSTQPSKAKTGREKALEALKKRRAVTSDLPSSSAGRKKPIIVDSDSDMDTDLEVIQEEQDGGSSEEEGSAEEGEDEDNMATAHEAFNENEDDEAFIDDEDALIGMPVDHPSIPLQFSSMRNKKPRELFKYAIEWMVQKKINPAFSSDDEIYHMTFQKLNDEVNGLASSKYHSSVWTADFTRAIKARPELVVNDIDKHMRAIMEPHCEACNRKNHTATSELSLTGKPYDKDTLEPLANNASDSDSDSDSSAISSTGSEAALNGEKPTYDSAGERIPPESRIFKLGSTCRANAQIAHTLYHWRYHLNSWVVDYLVAQGHCTAEQLVARDKWSVRKREKYGNKIVDEMERVGEIKRLHRQYKQQVDFALEAQNDYRRGWGRRG
ncbi:hypothetical protein N0V90_010439 [Kalmusia sp. IMI 367209]|nr:hypothetical protein N0V90_010439 [Kalmusia sp. IMI 367209]